MEASVLVSISVQKSCFECWKFKRLPFKNPWDFFKVNVDHESMLAERFLVILREKVSSKMEAFVFWNSGLKLQQLGEILKTKKPWNFS